MGTELRHQRVLYFRLQLVVAVNAMLRLFFLRFEKTLQLLIAASLKERGVPRTHILYALPNA